MTELDIGGCYIVDKDNIIAAAVHSLTESSLAHVKSLKRRIRRRWRGNEKDTTDKKIVSASSLLWVTIDFDDVVGYFNFLQYHGQVAE